MSTIAHFHAEHRELVAKAKRLLGMVSAETPPTIEALTAARWDLLNFLDSHLAREQRFVQQELGHSFDFVARSLAKRYINELLDIRLAVSAHSGKWNNLLVQADWAGYREALHGQLTSMVKRMEWEERVIFPSVELERQRKAQLTLQPGAAAHA